MLEAGQIIIIRRGKSEVTVDSAARADPATSEASKPDQIWGFSGQAKAIKSGQHSRPERASGAHRDGW